jgi:hypothetical protein
MLTHIQCQNSGRDDIAESNYRRFKYHDTEETIDFFHATRRSRNKVTWNDSNQRKEECICNHSTAYFISSSSHNARFSRVTRVKKKEDQIFLQRKLLVRVKRNRPSKGP